MSDDIQDAFDAGQITKVRMDRTWRNVRMSNKVVHSVKFEYDKRNSGLLRFDCHDKTFSINAKTGRFNPRKYSWTDDPVTCMRCMAMERSE